MKNSLIISLSLLWGCTLFAFHTTPEYSDLCRIETLNYNNSLSELERIQWDLTNGIWLTNNDCDDYKTTIQFHENGIATLISEKGDERPDLQSLSWKLESFSNLYFMVWMDESLQKEKTYKIEQTCEGILLTDPASDAEICLKKLPNITSKKLNFISTSLIGKWENATYPFNTKKGKQIKRAFFHYEFDKSGAYHIKFGTAKKTIEEKGTWEISRDGQFVMFYPNDNTNKINLAKILHLDLDEMVLAQNLSFNAKDSNVPEKWEVLTFMK